MGHARTAARIGRSVSHAARRQAYALGLILKEQTLKMLGKEFGMK